MSNVVQFRINSATIPLSAKPKIVTWGEFLAHYPAARAMRDHYIRFPLDEFGPREMLSYLNQASTDNDKLAVLAVWTYGFDEYNDSVPRDCEVYSHG